MIPMPVMVGPATSTDKFGNPAQNNNPFGFTAPTGPASQALVSYYNKATGQTWTAPSGGYTPPSADWIQGYPGSSQITPMPGFAPGMDPVQPVRAPGNITPMPGFAPGMDPVQPAPRATIGGITAEAPLSEMRSTAAQQPYMPIMTGTPAPNQNMGGLNSLLSSLYSPQQPVNRPANTGGLNALVAPQVPRATGLFGSTQPFARNRPMPIAGSLPSLRMRPTFARSLSVPFARPPLRR